MIGVIDEGVDQETGGGRYESEAFQRCHPRKGTHDQRRRRGPHDP